MQNFKNWMNEYAKEMTNLKVSLEGDMDGKRIKESDLHRLFLQNYIAFRSEKINRKLVWATWALAIATIILAIITFIIR